MKAVFVFLTVDHIEDVDNFKSITTQSMTLTTVGVTTYEDAVKQIEKLIAQGYTTIELCAGFGTKGVAMIQNIIPKGVYLGVVRFDIHPQLHMQSGDAFF
ncbi:DUF6506 family protein [Acinetobacter boissieri]|uniref:Uncharacterized protein n=1 Tax=Acinetobacter boissieri TaxID=1219383 RepID=A0A1G6GMX0_9GAMM|nr:DUF6506 family protein [Acinetobacter boissieri]SDB83085.1 hypothetical protein SAMN05421733_101415 [Acinetobacter boissieri]